MYISLYTARQLKRLKDRLLWYGLFLASGGGASLLFNTILQDQVRWLWALGAAIVLLVGLYLVVLAIGAIHMKDTYVAITPLKISYRLQFFSREYSLSWQQVADIQFSERYVLFNLNGGRQKMLNLTAIESPNVASRVAISLHTTALKQNLKVNSFQTPLPDTAKSVY